MEENHRRNGALVVNKCTNQGAVGINTFSKYIKVRFLCPIMAVKREPVDVRAEASMKVRYWFAQTEQAVDLFDEEIWRIQNRCLSCGVFIDKNLVNWYYGNSRDLLEVRISPSLLHIFEQWIIWSRSSAFSFESWYGEAGLENFRNSTGLFFFSRFALLNVLD